MLIVFASLMHLLWGILLLCNGELSISATRIITHGIADAQYAALIYIISALLPVLTKLSKNSWVSLFSLLPQQLLLIMSGISAIVSIITGMYPDGTIRPSA